MNFSDRDVFGQLWVRCGQACITFAYAYLNGVKLTRQEFIKLEDRICRTIDLRRDSQSYPPVPLNAFRDGAREVNLDSKNIQLKRSVKLNPSTVLLVRVRWASYISPIRLSHFMYDDEHYVVVTSWEDNMVTFWEPSFGRNGKKDGLFCKNEADHIGVGSPWWQMEEKEFLERNSGITLPQDRGWGTHLNLAKNI